jgi:hypothetical protein
MVVGPVVRRYTRVRTAARLARVTTDDAIFIQVVDEVEEWVGRRDILKALSLRARDQRG